MLATEDKQFILNCLNPPTESLLFTQISRTVTNWKLLADEAQKLQLASIIYNNLKTHRLDSCVPERFINQCKEAFYFHQARNMSRYKSVKDILIAFAQDHIPVICLKGVVLATLAYDHIGLRAMKDVDLLVKSEHLDRAEEILRQHQYRVHTFTSRSEEWYREHHHHLPPYASPDKTICIELHHHIIPKRDPIAIPISDIWQRAQPVTIANVPCYTLDAEDSLIHHCYHLSANNYFIRQLRAVYDTKQIIQYLDTRLNWETFVQRARSYRITHHVYYPLWAANNLVDADVPSSVLKTLRASKRQFPLKTYCFKALIHKAVFITDPEGELIPSWFIKGLCQEFLSSKARWKKLKNILMLVSQHYKRFARHGARQHGHTTLFFFLFGYPYFLIRKWFSLMLPRSLQK